jgi:hypothetical protein
MSFPAFLLQLLLSRPTGQVSSDGLGVVLHFVGGEAWRVRCSSRFLGLGASDTGESSLASTTRARREDSGRQEARGRDALTELLRRAVQYST